MINDITDANPEEAVPCFALSKNDSYVMSASGGQISLFNMMTFKVNYSEVLLYVLSNFFWLFVKGNLMSTCSLVVMMPEPSNFDRLSAISLTMYS